MIWLMISVAVLEGGFFSFWIMRLEEHLASLECDKALMGEEIDNLKQWKETHGQ